MLLNIWSKYSMNLKRELKDYASYIAVQVIVAQDESQKRIESYKKLKDH